MTTDPGSNNFQDVDAYLKESCFSSKSYTRADKKIISNALKNGLIQRTVCKVSEFKLDEKLIPIKEKYYDENYDIKQEIVDVIVQALGSELISFGTGIDLVLFIEVKNNVDVDVIYSNIEKSLLEKLNIQTTKAEFAFTTS